MSEPARARDDEGCTDLLDRMQRVLPASGGPWPLHAPVVDGNAWAYVKDCLDTGWVSTVGSWVDRFEAMLADATGARHAVATVNGTAALHAALLVAGVQPGDEVLVPSFTFVASANAISYCGAVPHFVDCEDRGFGVDARALDAHLAHIADMRAGQTINSETGRPIRALLAVHIFGHPAEMPALCAAAERYGLMVIEDAAESLGARIGDIHTGRFGRVGTLSFNGNKTITTGGGGAVLTDDDLLARRVRHLTTTARAGDGSRLDHDMVGYNYRLPNINAALGCAQLEGLEARLDAKRRLAARYSAAFAGFAGARFAAAPDWGTSNHWLNGLVFDNGPSRDAALSALAAAGYGARPFWVPLHRMPMYAAAPRADLTVTETLAARGLTLPSGPALDPDFRPAAWPFGLPPRH